MWWVSRFNWREILTAGACGDGNESWMGFEGAETPFGSLEAMMPDIVVKMRDCGEDEVQDEDKWVGTLGGVRFNSMFVDDFSFTQYQSQFILSSMR